MVVAVNLLKSSSAADAFTVVLDIAISTTLISYLWIFPAGIKLRRLYPDVHRPYRVPRRQRRHVDHDRPDHVLGAARLLRRGLPERPREDLRDRLRRLQGQPGACRSGSSSCSRSARSRSSSLVAVIGYFAAGKVRQAGGRRASSRAAARRWSHPRADCGAVGSTGRLGLVREPTVAPGLAPPWWLEEALAAEGDAPDAPALEGDAEVDVAIVGGGYTGPLDGARAARARPGPARRRARGGDRRLGAERAQRRLPARLLDAAGVASRASSATMRRVELVRAGGRGSSRRARVLRGARRGRLAARGRLPEGLGGAVPRTRRSSAPSQPPQALGVEEEGRAAHGRRGRRSASTPRGSAAASSSGSARRSSRRDSPARCAGAVLADGIALHERTRVTQHQGRQPRPCSRRRADALRAPEVVVATNAWMTGWTPVRRRLTNFGSYVVLTEPVPHLLEEIGWTGGEAISDGRMFVHYFRTTPDGRVAHGQRLGPDRLRRARRRPLHRRRPERRPRRARAPQAAAGTRPGARHARVGRADRRLLRPPALLRHRGRQPDPLRAGYSGHGVGPAWVGGQILASLVVGADDEWTALPLVTRVVPKLPPEPFRRLGGGLVRAAIMACEEEEEEGREGSACARAVSALPGLIGLQIGTR